MSNPILPHSSAPDRTVFFVSDGTGITAETFGHSVLTQFELRFKEIRLPFIDTMDKAHDAVRRINDACGKDGKRPIVFSTLVKAELSTVVRQSHGMHMDLIQTFVEPLEQELGVKSTHTIGRSHNIADSEDYKNRIEAINFSLAHDDGQSHKNLSMADVILVGGAVAQVFFKIKLEGFMSNVLPMGANHHPEPKATYLAAFENLRMADVDSVGGKNASLGEMISQLAGAGVRVPGGFATTAQAFRDFLSFSENGGTALAQRIADRLAGLNIDDVRALAQAGAEIRQWIIETPFQPRLQDEIGQFYQKLVADSSNEMSFAVRSSATAEDLPDASFAGQQETFLNVVGIDNVLEAIKHVFASLYNDRAISYRVHKGFTHADVALSAGVQRMVRSDVGAAGVMFTLDTESGFQDVVFITSSYGLGETVVQGAVNPDEFYVHKPMLEQGKLPIIRRNIGSKLIKMEFTGEMKAGRSVKTVDVPIELRNRYSLSDVEIVELAKYAVIIEKHYGRPMDIEWGKDGRDGKLYILQARPETVKSQQKSTDAQQRFKLKGTGTVLTAGRAIGQKIGAGPVRVIHDPADMERVQPGDVLVADMTDPNWEPVMKRASAIVTNRGGRTCHAAIIARELGVPAVVGCGDATDVLKDGTLVTVSCAEGDEGKIYDGLLETEISEIARGELPQLPLKIMMNVGNPQLAFDFQSIPNHGVGLARLEFIIKHKTPL